MDVALTRDGDIRRWNIAIWSMGWSFSYAQTGSVTMSGCQTFAEAVAKQREWDAEIDAARADGWR